MKRLIGLFIVLLLACSCSPLNRSDYQCTIAYTLDGVSHTQTVTLTDVPSRNVPAYMYDGKKLKIIVVPDTEYSAYFCDTIIYQGTLPVKVDSFDYRLVRNYKVSQLTGKELKRK